MATRMDSTRSRSTIDAITPARRVRGKGKKQQQDEAQSHWNDVLRESMDDQGEPRKDPAETALQREKTPPPPREENTPALQPELEDGEALLKKIVVRPEGLLDSYSTKSYAPVSPGKWLDSKG